MGKRAMPGIPGICAAGMPGRGGCVRGCSISPRARRRPAPVAFCGNHGMLALFHLAAPQPQETRVLAHEQPLHLVETLRNVTALSPTGRLLDFRFRFGLGLGTSQHHEFGAGENLDTAERLDLVHVN